MIYNSIQAQCIQYTIAFMNTPIVYSMSTDIYIVYIIFAPIVYMYAYEYM